MLLCQNTLSALPVCITCLHYLSALPPPPPHPMVTITVIDMCIAMVMGMVTVLVAPTDGWLVGIDDFRVGWMDIWVDGLRD